MSTKPPELYKKKIINAVDVVNNHFLLGFPTFLFLYFCSNGVSKFLNDRSSSFHSLHFDTRYFRTLPPSLPFITSLPFHLCFYPLHINHHRRISHPLTALHSCLFLRGLIENTLSRGNQGPFRRWFPRSNWIRACNSGNAFCHNIFQQIAIESFILWK